MQSISFPSGVRRGEWQVIARLAVDQTGRVVDCVIVEPSGSDQLDMATCRAAREHARYQPALDSEGAPAAADIISSNTFQVA